MQYSHDTLDLDQAVARLSDQRRPDRKDLVSENNEASASWDLNTPFSKAKELAAIGWQEKAERIWQAIRTLAPMIEYGMSTNYDVSGETVDVGKYLEHEPECMMSVTAPVKNVVAVAVNIAARCNADAELLSNRGAAIAAVVHSLQSGGRGVSLRVQDTVSDTYSGGNVHETSVEIEKSGEYIHPARLAFWLAHPAALRRCMFRFKEQQEPAVRQEFGFYNSGGYGHPTNSEASIKDKSVVYIPFPETNELREYQTLEGSLKRIVSYFKERNIPLAIK